MRTVDTSIAPIPPPERLCTPRRDQAIPLYHQIYVQLRDEIRSGARPLGSRLPTEDALARALDVSRVTTRRALAQLAATGLVERRRRVGTTVVGERNAPIEGDIDQAIEALLTFGRSTQVRLICLREVQAQADVADALSIAVGAGVLRITRLRLLRGSPIGHVLCFLPISLAPFFTRERLHASAMLELLHEADVQIGSGTQAITATAADGLVAEALQIDVGVPLLRVDRTLMNRDGVPVQFVVAHYRPDRYQIRLDLQDGARVSRN